MVELWWSAVNTVTVTPPTASVPVSNNTPLIATVTDAAGVYTFPSVFVGTYRVSDIGKREFWPFYEEVERLGIGQWSLLAAYAAVEIAKRIPAQRFAMSRSEASVAV